jgi:hypothetical protein
MEKEALLAMLEGRWHYFVPYQSDVNKALQDLRIDVFAQKAFYTDALPMREWLNRDRDRLSSEMVEVIEKRIAYFEAIPEPATIDELIENDNPRSTRSILDVDRVAPRPEYGAVAVMPDELAREIFGTHRPSRSQAEENFEHAFRAIDANYFLLLYEGGSPSEIMFIGHSELRRSQDLEQQGVRGPLNKDLMEANRKSWAWILSFLDHFSTERKQTIRPIIRSAIEFGWDNYFRAGQSVWHLIFSTAEKHGLEHIQPPPPRVTMGYKEGRFFVAMSRSNLWSTEPEQIDFVSSENALVVFQSYLSSLWNATRPSEQLPDALASQSA